MADDTPTVERPGVGFLPTDCPTRDHRGRCRCHDWCDLCRHPKHSAIHLVGYAQSAGSPPWGHQWQPTRRKRRR